MQNKQQIKCDQLKTWQDLLTFEAIVADVDHNQYMRLFVPEIGRALKQKGVVITVN